MLLAIIAFTIQVIVLNDPPTFPLSKNYDDSVDCFNIISSTILIEKSRINVSLRVRDFIQYPIEVASSMVHIKSRVGNVNFTFSPAQFWDLESNLHYITFCVLQTAAGHVDASLYCQNKLLARTRNKITSIDAYPVGWSRIFDDSFFSNTFTDVCIDHNLRLVFCSKQEARIGKIRASFSEEVPVFITSKSAQNFQQSNKISSPENFSIFIPFNTIQPPLVPLNAINLTNSSYIGHAENFLFDTVLPVLASLSQMPNRYLAPNLAVYNQLKPILKSRIQLLSKSCHTTLKFLPTTGSCSTLIDKGYATYAEAQSHHARLLLSLRSETLSKIKQFYRPGIEKIDIVLDSGMSKLAGVLDPSWRVFVIDDKTDFTTAATAITSATVLVASHIRSLFFAALMDKSATVIEVVPDGMNCNAFEETLKGKFDANYVLLESGDKKCRCDASNLTCYFEQSFHYEMVDQDALLSIVRKSMHSKII